MRKIDGLFDCELEPTGECRFDDNEQLIGPNIRKCPTGKTNLHLENEEFYIWTRYFL